MHHTMNDIINATLTTFEPAWNLDSDVQHILRDRTNLYFFSISDGQTVRDIAVKVKQNAAYSQREFEVMQRIHLHFESFDDQHIRGLRAWAYLPEHNAIVMDRLHGDALYDKVMKAVHHRKKRQAALQWMHGAGKWLNTLHTIDQPTTHETIHVGHNEMIARLHEEATILATLGIHTENWAWWSDVMGAFEDLSCNHPVWSHTDYHPRNVMVLTDNTIVGIDTKLSTQCCPYYDIGKFIAEWRTKGARLLTYRQWPPRPWFNELLESFLHGYFGDPQSVDRRHLALYEGYFLIRKWRLMAEKMEQAIPVGTRIAHFAWLTPVYSHMLNRWQQSVLQVEAHQ